MPEVFTLTCPICGGRLQITPDMDRFACAHCGNEHIVTRGTGTVSLQPIREDLHVIGSGVDRTASELAIKRINAEMNVLQGELSALKSKHNSYSLFLVVGLLGISASLCAPLVEFSVGNVFIGLAILAILGVPPILISRRTTSNLKPEIDRLSENLRELAKEYSHHHAIVGQ